MLFKKSFLTKHMWQIQLDDKHNNIKQVQSQNFLGIIIDEHLNWNKQTGKICSELKSFKYSFKQLVKYCDTETLKTVYYSYVVSKIRYGILSWGVTIKQNIESILKCQKALLRIIDKAQFLDSCKEIFKKLKILTVPSLIIKESCLHVKKQEEYLQKLFS